MPPSKSIFVAFSTAASSPQALKNILQNLSPHSKGTFFILPKPDPVGGLDLSARELSEESKLPVLTLENDTLVKPGHVYLLRPFSWISIGEDAENVRVHDTVGTTELGTTVDLSLKSLAKPLGSCFVAVLLSGGGTDGTQGVSDVHDAGGMTIALAPSTADFPSMAESAIATGLIDHILTPTEIASELTEYEKYIFQFSHKSSSASLRDQIGSSLIEICEILYRATKHDFKHYKTSTLIRRIQRRMQVLQMDAVADYIERLSGDAQEIDNLFKELLINVTSFFRDPDAFEALNKRVLAPALSQRPADQKFRVWVAGCSTGEEVYTLAILIKEHLELSPHPCEVQIIATDIDEHALSVARKGIYPAAIEKHVSPERLSKYFVRRAGRYHVSKELRELCLFSSHNLINDPPFSQLDLISCRNVLIYLGLHLQKKLIPVFHYALKPDGFLFLGNSESLTSHEDLFRLDSAKYRLAQRKATAIRSSTQFPTAMPSHTLNTHKTSPVVEQDVDLHMVGQRILLDEFAPKYAICNEDGQIISVSAGIAEYLEPAAGVFRNSVLKLVKPSLRISLRLAFNEAKKHKRRTKDSSASLKTGSQTTRIEVVVQPMPKLGEDADLYMVVFRDLGTLTSEELAASHLHHPANAEVVEQLERELSSTRQNLDKTVQELESSNEELKSSNEELLSMNEELQSANEELEASKEEVQRTNEALHNSNMDLENLLASSQIATLFLDMDLRIRSFTPAVADIYAIQPGDIGRPVADFSSKALNMPAYPNPRGRLAAEIKHECEIHLNDGRVFLRTILPYRSKNKNQDGIVVNFFDVTKIRRSEDRLEMMIRASTSFMALLQGPEFVFERFNDEYKKLTGNRAEIGKSVAQCLPEVTAQGFIQILRQVRETHAPYVGKETPIELRNADGVLEKRYMDFSYTPEGRDHIFVHGYDVTEKVLARSSVENERENFRNLFRQTPEMVCILRGPNHVFEFVNEAHVRALGFDATGMAVRDAQPESVEVHGILDDVYRTGVTAELNEIPVTLGDRVRYFNLTYSARRDSEGQINGVMILGMEVTHEVVSRAELKRARDEAEKANSTKTRFLANMSHEIRTPLGAIIGFSDLLSQVFTGNEKAHNYVTRISKNAKQLNRLIDELLDLSKIEAQCLHIDQVPMDLDAAVDDAIAAVSLLASEKNLHLEVKKAPGLPRQIKTDPTRFRQILINVLGNAVKFTEKGKVSLRVEHAGGPEHNLLTLRVQDTGIGLSPEHLERLFKPFSQADPSITRQFGGTGLGLALSRELARLLKGDLELESSSPGQGSTFKFTLQYAKDEALDQPQRLQTGLTPEERKALHGLRVLVVDDSTDNQFLVGLYLDKNGVAHDTAIDGIEGVEKALMGAYDLVLMDLQMPRLDGMSAVAQLRSKGYQRPIIALTAHALRSERERCLANGFNGYVTKPIDQTLLMRSILEAAPRGLSDFKT